MQSLESSGLRVEIFAPHAPSFAPAPSFEREIASVPIIYLHAQPRTSAPAILSDVSASVRFVSPEPPTPPSSTQVGPSPVPSVLPAQATSSEPSASAAPNTPLVTSIVPASPSSPAVPKAQAIQPAALLVLNTRAEFTAATDSISSASSMQNTALAASAQTASPRLNAVPIIYLHALEFGATGMGEIYELVSRRSGADFVLAAIYLNEAQWGDKLSPWAAKSPFKGVRDFAGGGAAHLEKFTDELIPRIERHVFGAGKPAWRACAGYSLAGLFSAYAAFASDKFQKIACVSASFWFGGFDAFVAAHSPQRGLAHVYASLGEAEMNPKNPRGALCGETARNFIAKCRSAGAKAEFEQNPGGHMQDEIARISKAISSLVNS